MFSLLTPSPVTGDPTSLTLMICLIIGALLIAGLVIYFRFVAKPEQKQPTQETKAIQESVQESIQELDDSVVEINSTEQEESEE